MFDVLLVDNEPAILQALTHCISWENQDCRIAATARDGAEAVQKIQAAPPDIVISDIRMPEMDGYEACRQIRGAGRRDSLTIPIVAMTANAFSEDIELAGKSGMNAHLAKPVDAEQMISLLKEVLAGEKNG